MSINERVYKETYEGLRKKNVTKITFPQFVERMQGRNDKIKKREYEERKLKIR